jgi:hypothetical protein
MCSIVLKRREQNGGNPVVFAVRSRSCTDEVLVLYAVFPLCTLALGGRSGTVKAGFSRQLWE